MGNTGNHLIQDKGTEPVVFYHFKDARFLVFFQTFWEQFMDLSKKSFFSKGDDDFMICIVLLAQL